VDPTPDASKISVAETLALLDTLFAPLAENVANGRSVFWIGSGISLGRAAGLWDVVIQVLEFLRTRIDPAAPMCGYRRALDDALDLTDLSSDSREAIDLGLPVEQWSERDAIARQLVNRYGALLDTPVTGQSSDYLLWEAADVLGNFSPALEPDSEHIGLALLALEGAAPEIVSANWDGLIEKAVESLSEDSSQVVVVCVRAQDLRQDRRLMRLLKFHGCAIRAHQDPTTYRAYLIGRASQITNWPNEPRFQLMCQELVGLVSTRPTLMIGLSAQDEDIRQVFSKAQNQMQWEWDENERVHVFADRGINANHRQILRLAFDPAYPAHGNEIETNALLPAYAKATITALVLSVLAAKMRALANTCECPARAHGIQEAVSDGLIHLRDRIAAAAEPDRLEFLKGFIREYAWAESLFRFGRQLDTVEPRRYRPLTQLPLERIPGDPSLPTNGAREACAAVGLFGKGEMDGLWSLGTGETPAGHHGALRVVSGGGERAVYFVANGEVAVRLRLSGVIDDSTADAVVIYSNGPADVLQRSPAGVVGRTNATVPREVSMRELLRDAKDDQDLIEAFRQASSL
jgi:hypothetical protein